MLAVTPLPPGQSHELPHACFHLSWQMLTNHEYCMLSKGKFPWHVRSLKNHLKMQKLGKVRRQGPSNFAFD